MTSQSQALSNAGEGKSHMPLAVLGVPAVVVGVFAAINPWTAEMRAKAQALLTEEVARENTAFCANLSEERANLRAAWTISTRSARSRTSGHTRACWG